LLKKIENIVQEVDVVYLKNIQMEKQEEFIVNGVEKKHVEFVKLKNVVK